MNKKVLLRKLANFQKKLQEHQKIWGNSLDNTIPDYPLRSYERLKTQQNELTELLYVLDPFINKYSRSRHMRHPRTGITWDAYRAAIGNDVAQIKGPSLENVIQELAGIIAVIKLEKRKDIKKISHHAINQIGKPKQSDRIKIVVRGFLKGIPWVGPGIDAIFFGKD